MDSSEQSLSIGEVAEQTGLSVHALRWFEREELFLRPIPRVHGRRVFDQSDVSWLNLCNRFRASGMPIADIRRYVALVRAGAGNEGERFALLEAHEQRVRAHIAELQESLTIINGKVDVYRRHLAEGVAAGLWASTTAGDGHRSTQYSTE
jgi:DNA-binding transcriptional MerR regulator